MALIQCPDCGSDVSDQAPYCKDCGRSIAAATGSANEGKSRGAQSQRNAGPVVLAVVLVLIVMAMGMYLVVLQGNSEPPPPKDVPTDTSKEPDVQSTHSKPEGGDLSPKVSRFYSLNDAIVKAYGGKDLVEVKALCAEYLSLAKKFPNDWNYGNAIHKGNIYLGLVALDEHRIGDSKKHLLKAGDTPGSPQLNSFGPNMSLAKALLKEGEKQTVLEYIGKVSRFWKLKGERLDNWQKDIEVGKIPDFGANLLY